MYRLRRGEAPVSEREDASVARVDAQKHVRQSLMHEHMDEEDYLLRIEL